MRTENNEHLKNTQTYGVLYTAFGPLGHTWVLKIQLAPLNNGQENALQINKTPAMQRDIVRLQLANNRHLIERLPPPW